MSAFNDMKMEIAEKARDLGAEVDSLLTGAEITAEEEPNTDNGYDAAFFLENEAKSYEALLQALEPWV